MRRRSSRNAVRRQMMNARQSAMMMMLEIFMVRTPYNLLQNHFAQRVLDDACAARGLETRDDVADDGLLEDGVHRNPVLIAQVRDRGRVERGQDVEDGVEVFLLDVEHETNLILRSHRALEHQREGLNLRTLPRI